MGIFDKAFERLATEIVKVAPVATAIEQHQMGSNATYGTSAGLDRNPQFGSVPFAPGIPIIPGAINPPRQDGRPDPRRYEYQVAQNINITETRLVPFKVLRASADQIDIVRRCIEVIKAKMGALQWDIVLADDAVEKIMSETGATTQARAMALAKDKFQSQISAAKGFWKVPDISNGLAFKDWLNMALEEVLVLDALAIWPQKTVGGDLRSLQILDGSTIKPLIDDRGMRPEAPYPAYQQILYGFPRSEFSAPTENEDADGEFTSDELAYFIRNRRTNTVYGYSPTERSLNLADIYLRRQQWLRAEYTDGVLPDLMFKTDANFGNSPDLLRAYENIINDDLAGQTQQRKKARILPAGLEPVQFDGYGEKFKDVLDDYLVNSICGHFNVMPTEIGFTPKSGLGGAGHQQGQANTGEQLGLLPLADWLARQISQMSYVFLGMPRELEFQFMPSSHNDQTALAQANDIKIKHGTLTINEARSEEGLPLIDADAADQPLIVLPTGSFFITDDGLQPIGQEPGATPDTPPAPDTQPEETPEEGVSKAAREEAKTFIKWLRKSPNRPFEFKALEGQYAETLNKFVSIYDYDGARWYAERYLG